MIDSFINSAHNITRVCGILKNNNYLFYIFSFLYNNQIGLEICETSDQREKKRKILMKGTIIAQYKFCKHENSTS